jgi:hypothetical protein
MVFEEVESCRCCPTTPGQVERESIALRNMPFNTLPRSQRALVRGMTELGSYKLCASAGADCWPRFGADRWVASCPCGETSSQISARCCLLTAEAEFQWPKQYGVRSVVSSAGTGSGQAPRAITSSPVLLSESHIYAVTHQCY